MSPKPGRKPVETGRFQGEEKNVFREIFSRLFQDERIKPFVFLVIAMIAATSISPRFISWENIRAVLISAAPLMLLAIGEALVVLTGMIDLGPEAVLASSGVIIANLDLVLRTPPYVSIGVTLLYGLVVGLVTGILVVKARIPSFVVTLGNYWGLRGLAMVLTGGYPISPTIVSPPKPFSFEGLVGSVLGFPTMVLIAIVIGALFQVYITQFKKGIDIYAVGGNEVAARNCGVNVEFTKIFVFMISGLLGALAGIIMAAWVNQAYAWTAQGYTLQTIAAVVLGGIPFTGGYGTVVGVLIGSFIISMISDIIVLMGISPMYNYIAVAIVLILAGLQVRGTGFTK
jgi:ribose/xylose/arabinose/galactoside ABC-type transport system permease subunit